MTSLLLTISFFLHFILFMAVFHLKRELTKSNDPIVPEMKELFERYLNEIREENKQLKLDMNTYRLKKQEDNKEHNTLYEQKIDDEEFVQENHRIDHEQKDHPFIHSMIGSKTDEIETSLQAKVLQLYDQGLSIEQISKTLNCGKTEAELIIQFFQQKNS